MLLRDLQVCDGRSRPNAHIASDLDRFAIQVTDLYLRPLKRRVQTGPTAKVVITLQPAVDTPDPAMGGAPVAHLIWPFGFDELGDDERRAKRVLLDAIHDALVWAALQSGWNVAAFVDARQAALDAGLTLSGWAPLPRSSSPARNASVAVFYEFVGTVNRVWLVRFDTERGERERTHLFDATPTTPIDRLVTGIRWIGNRRLIVTSRAYVGTSRFDVRLGTPTTVANLTTPG